jgi:hypothetical protein
MDGTAAINHNLEALKRILAGLVRMAGLSVSRACGEGPHPEAHASPELVEGAPKRTLPRHLRLAILRLLRPAESAARRLIIAAAHGLVVTLPCQRKPKPKPATVEPFLRRFGIAVVMSPADIARAAAAKRAAAQRAALSLSKGPRTPALPLLDPLKHPFRVRRRYVPAHAAPRIMLPGIDTPHRLPPPPAPNDQVDVTRLSLRLAALAAALDDLPGQAKRFARWRARRIRERDNPTPGRIRRIWPLRPGRPPGGRLSRFDPSARRRSRIRDVDEILAHAHALALYALQYPDTS